ncbi:MAG: M28 family peptidase, partial [Ilumatobacter sp.]|nr:M28 family peptidase [Ilumatobacter sp.]
MPDAFELVRTLAADDLDGRDNETPGSERAQDVLVEWLTAFATPLPGAEGFRQSFDEGTNLIGVVTGAELPDEYVVIGAHYDHLSGVACAGQTVDDTVCNGAADNAAGVAAAIS